MLTSFASADTYEIVNISQESLKKACLKERADKKYRVVKQMAVIGGIAAAIYAIISLQNQFGSDYVKASDVVNLKDVAEFKKSKEVDPSTANFIWNGITSVPVTLTQWVVGVAPSIIGSTVLGIGTNAIADKWRESKETEKIKGFIVHKTEIWSLCAMLQELAAPFDIYSKRLSAEVNFGEHKVLIEQFVKDATNVIAEDAEWTRFRLSQMLRKDYNDRSVVLDGLQNQAINVMAYQQRLENDENDVSSLFESERSDRESLAEFGNHLVKEVERVTAFFIVKTEGHMMAEFYKTGIDSLVDKTNIFAKALQEKLESPTKELYEQSKTGHGLFDLVFDFKQWLNKHTNTLNLRLKCMAA